jgi:outer membrane protein assembly factor BamA
LTRRDSLNKLIANNASYKYIFNDGLILSTIINYKIAGGRKNLVNLANFSLETSGLIAGLFRSAVLDKYLYRFIKLDAEFSETFKIRRSALAWRIFGGIGFEIPSSHDTNDVFLPFFREYYAGGPNSMRAWALRKLGPGSTIKSFSNDIAPDRFGDMRLEANAEYRFYLTQLFGFNLEGALFTDIGNVWFLRPNKDFPDGEIKLNRLWKDIAIGTGTGLRVDFGFLKARFDYAYKVKNPSPENISEQNKWFYDWQLFNGQFQLGIDYPF